MGKTSSAVKNRYAAKAYDPIRLNVPKGTKELFRAACERNGETMNGVLNKFIKAYIEEHEGD
ncbi:MAG: hypothetical protein ACLSFI_03200 [Christensenellaceae bacterium]